MFQYELIDLSSGHDPWDGVHYMPMNPVQNTRFDQPKFESRNSLTKWEHLRPLEHLAPFKVIFNRIFSQGNIHNSLIHFVYVSNIGPLREMEA